MSNRSGFALADVLIATTLLVVGLLALVGIAGELQRADTTGRTEFAAASLLADRVERTAAARCIDATGLTTSRGLREAWTSRADSGLAHLADTVTHPRGGAAIDAVVRCAP